MYTHGAFVGIHKVIEIVDLAMINLNFQSFERHAIISSEFSYFPSFSWGCFSPRILSVLEMFKKLKQIFFSGCQTTLALGKPENVMSLKGKSYPFCLSLVLDMKKKKKKSPY